MTDDATKRAHEADCTCYGDGKDCPRWAAIDAAVKAAEERGRNSIEATSKAMRYAADMRERAAKAADGHMTSPDANPQHSVGDCIRVLPLRGGECKHGDIPELCCGGDDGD